MQYASGQQKTQLIPANFKHIIISYHQRMQPYQEKTKKCLYRLQDQVNMVCALR